MAKGKDKNPFKFQGFTERITNIKINVAHRVETTTAEPEERETFCNEALSKWKELNCTVDFQCFVKEVEPFVQTLAQLVHHEKAIMSAVQKHFLVQKTLALEPIIDIVVQLARDLQCDFYPYFPEIFDTFVILLSRNALNSEALEQIFIGIGYLFKFLWKYMVKDMDNVFRLYSPLFSKEQKPHIQQFAAESFAFLIRKVKDSDELFNMLFSSLDADNDIIEGIGCLLFETVKGVRKQFHSQTEKLLQVMLSKLGPVIDERNEVASDYQLPWKQVFECLCHTLQLMAKHTTREHSNVIEKCLTQHLKQLCLKLERINNLQECAAFNGLVCGLSHGLQLSNQWVSWKNGCLVTQPLLLLDAVKSLLRLQTIALKVTEPLLNLVSAMLQANFNELTLDIHIKDVIASIFHRLPINCVEFPMKDLFGFAKSLLKWSPFDHEILPQVLNMCQNKLYEAANKDEIKEIVLLLVEVVLSGVVNNEYGADIKSKQGSIYFPKCATKTGSRILDHLLEWLVVSDETDLSLAWGTLVLLPCLRPLNTTRCSTAIKDFIEQSLEFVAKDNESHWLFMMSQAVQSYLIIILHNKSIKNQLDIDFIVQMLSSFPDNFHALHACYAILSQAKMTQNDINLLSKQNLEKLYPLVRANLCHPAHLVRLKTLQILNEFEQNDFIASDENPNPGQCDVFRLCVDAETALPTFQEYRKKDVLLRKLLYSKPYYRGLPKLYKEVPVRFLIGQLYINFRPTWKTVIEVVKSLTDKENVNTFWTVYREYLEIAAYNAEKALSVRSAYSIPSTTYEAGAAGSLDQLFTSLFSIDVGQREDNRTDHSNFRHLMWQAMAEFPGVVELKSRDLVPLLLRFMNNEYERSDENSAPTQDIRKKNNVVMPSQSDDSEMIDNDHEKRHILDKTLTPNDAMVYDQSSPHRVNSVTDISQSNCSDNNDELNQSKGPQGLSQPSQRRASTKSLCVHLNLFSLFHNPKALSKENEVRQIYLTMLGHRDAEVQRLALTCLQTYKFPYMVPYKENLDRLMQDESFKDELTSLMMNEGSPIIDPVHREGLMPVVIRLLYGKMQRWTGVGSSGKAGVSARRSTVLRFLGNCTHEELAVFMEYILAPFKHLLKDPQVIPVARDLSCIVPIKKQIGFLNMMQQILLKLGSEADAFLPLLLQICLSLLSSCAYSLEHRDQVHPSHVAQLKQIRQLAINRLIDFFDAKPEYDFSMVIDTLFEAAVWPQISTLEQESIQCPTSVLKLLHCWSTYPHLIPLLSRQRTNHSDTSIMGHVLRCLCASNVNSSVVAMVMEITDNLLNAEDKNWNEEESVEGHSRSMELHSRLPLGTRLVLPHIHIIISYLTSTVKSFNKSSASKQGPKRTNTALPKLELAVLSRISLFVKDNENSASLLSLLIPLLRLRQKEEMENYVLKTIHHLLCKVDTQLEFIKPLAGLFSQFNLRSSRQLLCEVFQEIGRLTPSFEIIAKIVVQLNSWDEKKIEEPDYGTRIDGFTTASQLVESQTVMKKESISPREGSVSSSLPNGLSITQILPVLHNCLYFVHRSDDMALRDVAVNCINSIIQRVVDGNKEEEFSELILNCILPSCKMALKAKIETARSEFLGILSTMVCHFDNATFEDMRILVDKDPEMDFFENMRHIQVHRRIRALHRLETLCCKNTFKASTLTSFLLPLATAYLNEYSGTNKDHNVTTQAIATIGAISSCLPWSKYSYLLRTYLRATQREKEKQKIIVRVLVAVLNGFHFDLSTYTFTEDELLQEQAKFRLSIEYNEQDGAAKSSVKNQAEHDENSNPKEEEEDEEEDDGKEEGLSNTLDKELALRIYRAITKRILPQLSKSLTKKSQSFHKLANMKRDDEEEALRVPIVLAMVKLLQSLPQQTLHLHLPGLLLRVCVTLKSRARDVRDTARDVLCQIALSLGTKYFSFIVKEMRSALTRGYQLHVLGFTMHSLLDKMSSSLGPGDLDYCIPDITQILIEDLFGEVAVEREVEKLANKLHEAKSTKSYDSFEILAKYVGSTSLLLLVTPLQEVLDSNQSHKVSQRVEEALRRISVGLQANGELAVQSLMVFIHRIIHDKLPIITAKKEENKDESKSEPIEKTLRPQDSYLISSTPVRGGRLPGTSTKTNAHITVQFGLQMLNTTLKRGKLSSADRSHLQLLDPFVSVLSKCLNAKYTEVLTLSLRCLCLVIKLPLPSLDWNVPSIAKRLFKTLQNHAMSGGKVGENYEMVLSAFKAMTAIIRDFNKYTIAERHLQVLLGFVEEDMHDYTRQGTAFPLLKAILTRKLVVPEIHEVMKKVSQLSITGTTTTVQQQCRQCVIQYVLDYPLGKKLPRLLEFFASQLSYEHETGRLSALEMMTTFFNAFPESLLFDYASFFFLPLTTRLVNDDSASCRKLTATAIKALLQKLDVEHRDNLFAMVVQWFHNEKVVLRRLAAQLCGLFVEVERKTSDRRLQTTLPLIAEILEPAQYEVDGQTESVNYDSTTLTRSMDHLLFNALTTFAKILQDSKSIWSEKYRDHIESIWVSVESHLLHPHAWVRLVSSRLYGLLFSKWQPEELVESSDSQIPSYLKDDTYAKVVQLCNDFCCQLDSHFLHQDLSDQVIKNLVFLAKALILYESNSVKRPPQQFTLATLFGKIEKLATHEASQAPKTTSKRSCAMRWIAAITMVLGKDKITPYLKDILQPIHRELEIKTTYKDPELQKVTQEVLELVKGIVGRDSMSRVYANLQSDVTDLKEKRKKKRALEAVADPSQSARKKMKRNLSKKESRKRKIDKFKPERKLKARFVGEENCE